MEEVANELNHGGLVISLDLKLNWSVHDTFRYGRYSKNMNGVRQALPKILALFEQYGIHATWATVGLLFAESKAEMAHYLRGIPVKYDNMRYAAHMQLAKVGENEEQDLLHFGKSLIERIKSTPHQEIGSHTFSHFYCLEKGQTEADFRSDLHATAMICEELTGPMKSIVFPRNQINRAYFAACREVGLICYRGNENHPLYSTQNAGHKIRVKKWLDSYMNITGNHLVTMEEMQKDTLINVHSSAFLRPYCGPLRFLEGLKMKRIKEAMHEAATTKTFYHLWCHPHNFSKKLGKNLAILEEILQYYQELSQKYNFQSYAMYEVAELCHQLSKQKK